MRLFVTYAFIWHPTFGLRTPLPPCSAACCQLGLALALPQPQPVPCAWSQQFNINCHTVAFLAAILYIFSLHTLDWLLVPMHPIV